MEKYIIGGGIPLEGEVTISGAKNSAVAVIPAAILIDGCCEIDNIPDIKDVKILNNILKNIGADIKTCGKECIKIDASKINTYEAKYDMVKSLRASYYLLGALLGKFKKAEVVYPGGCDFGHRPIDQHIKGFEALGAEVKIEHGIIKISAEKLIGTTIYLDVVSVGATINIMLAATKAEGVTVIENVAKEPHVVDVANFLNAMGADIKGAGTDVIKIKGTPILKGGSSHSIIPDQIEAGTFMISAAVTKGNVLIKNVIPKHLEAISAKLIEMNIEIEEGEDWIRVKGNDEYNSINIKTLPYPGFPTDVQPQMSVLLTQANGQSIITEGVWDSRFQYTEELIKMGASIKVDGRIALINGKVNLTGAKVKALDLRAGAALVLAALCAKGTTEIYNLNYLDRGYENLEEKLTNLGANIERLSAETEEIVSFNLAVGCG